MRLCEEFDGLRDMEREIGFWFGFGIGFWFGFAIGWSLKENSRK